MCSALLVAAAALYVRVAVALVSGLAAWAGCVVTLYRARHVERPPVVAGDVVIVGQMAGVYGRPQRVHVTKVTPHVDGWAWIEGTEVDGSVGPGPRVLVYVPLDGVYPEPPR